MNERNYEGARVPMLDPSKNVYLRPEGRPEHSPTSVAPKPLLKTLSDDIVVSFRESFTRVSGGVVAAMGTPYYAKDGFILYCGDCIEFLEKMRNSNIRADLTVTSPPYNIGKEYENNRDLDDYLAWCERWISLVHAVTSDTGAFWLNLGYLEVSGKGLCVPIPYLLWNRTPFYLLQEVVWQYGAGVTTQKRFCPRNEKWLFYVRDPNLFTFNLDAVRDPNVKYPNQKKNGKLRCNPLGKNPSDVWSFPKVTTGNKRSSKERTDHPAQFPLSVVDRIIKASSNLSEVVLDPFSGSASAGIAAVGTGRMYIGFEIREDYCELAVERFETYLEERKTNSRQVPLFEV